MIHATSLTFYLHPLCIRKTQRGRFDVFPIPTSLTAHAAGTTVGEKIHCLSSKSAYFSQFSPSTREHCCSTCHTRNDFWCENSSIRRVKSRITTLHHCEMLIKKTWHIFTITSTAAEVKASGDPLACAAWHLKVALMTEQFDTIFGRLRKSFRSF